jgi:hypothetical protein
MDEVADLAAQSFPGTRVQPEELVVEIAFHGREQIAARSEGLDQALVGGARAHQHMNRFTAGRDFGNEMPADEARGSRDEITHARTIRASSGAIV